jgi:hypothetical protein
MLKLKAADILAKLGQTEAYERAAKIRGRTADTIPSPAEVKVFVKLRQSNYYSIANKQALDINSPEYMQELELLKQQFLLKVGRFIVL